MAVREARRPGILGNPSQPDRLGIFDQSPENATSLGKLTDRLHCPVVETHMQELFEQAISADDSACGVPGVRDISRGVDNAATPLAGTTLERLDGSRSAGAGAATELS